MFDDELLIDEPEFLTTPLDKVKISIYDVEMEVDISMNPEESD